MSKSVQVFIFRHGETDWNRVRRLQGHSDVPLNDAGREQAKILSHFFTVNPIDAVFSSDLQRSYETAQIATQHLKIPVSKHVELRECLLGEGEGLTRDEIIAKFGEDLWNRWASTELKNWDVILPGGESKRQLVNRAFRQISRLIESNNYDRVGVSTHGLVVKFLLHALLPELTIPVPIPNCVVYELNYKWERPTDSSGDWFGDDERMRKWRVISEVKE